PAVVRSVLLPDSLLGPLMGLDGEVGRDGCAGQEEQGRRSRQPRDDGIAATPTVEALEPAHGPGSNRLMVQEPPQFLRQFARCGIALSRCLGHRFQTNRLQVAGYLVVEPARRPLLLVQ